MAIFEDQLTIILPLKGREDFTRRWLDYYTRANLPWKTIIGDGDVNSNVSTILKEHKNLLENKVEYLSYDDVNYLEFYRKILNMIEHAETPYVMMCDNDDFLIQCGIEKAISFLNENPDYVSCGGANLGIYGVADNFDISQGTSVGGNWTNLNIIYDPIDLNMDKSEDRVLETFNNYQPSWYCIHRREALRDCFREIVNRKILDVLAMELFQASYMAAKGKVRQAYDSVIYVRQLNTSMVSKNTSDTFDRIFKETLVQDFNSICTSLAEVTAERNNKSVAELRESFVQVYIDYFRGRKSQYPTYRMKLSRMMRSWVYVLRAKIPFVHRLLQKYEIQSILRTISKNSLSDQDTANMIEKEFNNVFLSMTDR